jgi:hypothetical protein
VVVNDVPSPSAPGSELARELAKRLSRTPEVFLLDPKSLREEVEPLKRAAAGADVVLVSLFVRVRTGSGKLVLPDTVRDAVADLAAGGARLVAVSFGNPYLAADLPELATYLAAYGDQTVLQTAAARALFGEAEIGGRLPVSIPGVAARGSGITKPRTSTSFVFPMDSLLVIPRHRAPRNLVPGTHGILRCAQDDNPPVIPRRAAPRNLVSEATGTRSLAEPVLSERSQSRGTQIPRFARDDRKGEGLGMTKRERADDRKR